MSWPLVLIMILVVAMLVGPISMMRPTPRQKQLAALRQEAARLGLRVELQILDGNHLAAYEKRWPQVDEQKSLPEGWALDRLTYTHEIHFDGNWHWRDQRRAPESVHGLLRQALAQLPASVMAVEATPLGLRCVWREAGGNREIKVIADWLDQQIQRLWPFMHLPQV